MRKNKTLYGELHGDRDLRILSNRSHGCGRRLSSLSSFCKFFHQWHNDLVWNFSVTKPKLKFNLSHRFCQGALPKTHSKEDSDLILTFPVSSSCASCLSSTRAAVAGYHGLWAKNDRYCSHNLWGNTQEWGMNVQCQVRALVLLCKWVSFCVHIISHFLLVQLSAPSWTLPFLCLPNPLSPVTLCFILWTLGTLTVFPGHHYNTP